MNKSVAMGTMLLGAILALACGSTDENGNGGPLDRDPTPGSPSGPSGPNATAPGPNGPIATDPFIGLPPGPAAPTGPTGPQPGCTGLQCQLVSCESGQTTQISGTVYAPSGTLPLYNVMVYVPNEQLAPLTEGANCNRCDASVSGSPVASAISGVDGTFTLDNVPVGQNIPLVIQVGKWRRQVTIPEVLPCTNNTLTDPSQTRLPSSRAEGDMPRIALTTGELDALECLLRKIGIADSEFTPESEGGRVTLFAGHGGTSEYSTTVNAGASITPAEDLWNDIDVLKQYDVLLMACEGGEYPQEKSAAARQLMQEYADSGGRIFMSHWHKIWLDQGPGDFPDLVNFVNSDEDLTLTAQVDTTFPKGEALAEWLVNVGGSTQLGTVDLVDAQDTAQSENPDLAQRWIYTSSDPETVQYVSANTPLGAPAAEQCGRMVYSNIHVTTGNSNLSTDSDDPGEPFPSGCQTTGLTPQEKVLTFMLFDLSACLIPDDQPPMPPRIR
jgi:hypothetical protein